MALRLRRDVQKASYYVWFLGAEEAKGLRGNRVINSVIPYLIERSREQEPLKVTLQVSHKGVKILQGSSKHFIPHGAITSSLQIDDIVACVLLLYNPATKCPLHVHAYRCDSQITAEALHQQLQTLINRPENQKRFAELESRLGIVQAAQATNVSDKRFLARRAELSPRRFDSSLGSDTGTSTRESECSEENMSSSPMSPVYKSKGELLDSLAAELRAKLNGNGPPLLLPPRDYDTVHRSKGNLAAIELRRCRNRLIVGATNSSIKEISSRGSSGIGSDLAPSPDRQDDHTSSEEENWCEEPDQSIATLKTGQISNSIETTQFEDNYIKDLPSHDHPRQSRYTKDCCPNGQDLYKEADIRPIIMRPQDYESKFKRILMDKQYPDDGTPGFAKSGNLEGSSPQTRHFYKYPEEVPSKKYDGMERAFHKMSLHQREFDSDEEDLQHNLTDRQKHQEAYTKQGKLKPAQRRRMINYREIEEPTRAHISPHRYHMSPDRNPQLLVNRYKVPKEEDCDNKYNERNPYRKSDSLPYRESIEKLMKSPVMRYKSFDDNSGMEYDGDSEAMLHLRSTCSSEQCDNGKHFLKKRQLSNSPSDVSSRDRFHDAKEKFRAMEREKIKHSNEQKAGSAYNSTSLHRRGSLEPLDVSVRYDNWSDEEQHVVGNRKSSRRDNKKMEKQKDPAITNAKSLSNLNKGYRHSYAEPRPALPRSSGRVGLAAVNPF